MSVNTPLALIIEEKYFYQVIERVVKDINNICEGKDMDTIENTLLKINDLDVDFNFPIGDFNNLIENYEGEQNEIINKFAMILNIFKEKEIFEMKEFLNLKSEYQSNIKDLFLLYKERLNFVEEMNLWKGRKYDYKCYPNELLINKYLN